MGSNTYYNMERLKEICFKYYVIGAGNEFDCELLLNKEELQQAVEVIAKNEKAMFKDLPKSLYNSFLMAAENELVSLIEEGEAPAEVYDNNEGVELQDEMSEELLESYERQKHHEEDDFLLYDEQLCYDSKTKYWKILSCEKPNPENTLNLTVKREFFDKIVAGNKPAEYRDIKQTTFMRYLQLDKDGQPVIVDDLINDTDNNGAVGINSWNNGICPLMPKVGLHYLNLATGTSLDSDSVLVELDGFSFNATCSDEKKDASMWSISMIFNHIVEVQKKN